MSKIHTSKNFLLIGAAGYVAPRHMKAIKDTGNNLLAALDPNDSVGIMDSYFPSAAFFTEFERFDRYAEKLKREGTKIDYVSICSPNYLHDAHIRFGLRLGADVICEKPMVLNPWNVRALAELEADYPGKVYNILQLRLHPSVIKLKEKIASANNTGRQKVELRYITSRGKWYQYSWKGDPAKSGGIATNIGIHFFDMLIWIFGNVELNQVLQHDPYSAKGKLILEKAEIDWFLSIDESELPESVINRGGRTFRALTIQGEDFEFSEGFTDLHTESYARILAGDGFGIQTVEKSIDLAFKIRSAVSDPHN